MIYSIQTAPRIPFNHDRFAALYDPFYPIATANALTRASIGDIPGPLAIDFSKYKKRGFFLG